MANHETRTGSGRAKALPIAAVLVAAVVAGLAAVEAPVGAGADQHATANVTVIHKDPKGPWPGGNVWIGRSDCGSSSELVSEAGNCAVVINSSVGIDI